MPHPLVFDAIISPMIGKYMTPLKNAADTIKKDLLDAVKLAADDAFQCHPELRLKAVQVVEKNMVLFVKETKATLMEYIEAQKNFMNVQHTAFEVEFKDKGSKVQSKDHRPSKNKGLLGKGQPFMVHNIILS